MLLIGGTEVILPSDLEIRLVRSFAAPRRLVFEAYTTPALIRRWLLGPPGWEMPVCEVDLRVGGRYRYVWRHPDGQEMGLTGTFREIVPPERIASTEVFDQDWTGGEALGTVELSETAGRTTLTMTIRYGSQEVRDTVLKTGMAEGVEAGFARLDTVLAEAVG